MWNELGVRLSRFASTRSCSMVAWSRMLPSSSGSHRATGGRAAEERDIQQIGLARVSHRRCAGVTSAG